MEKEIIISVIVPVYNGEAFVRRAIDSVVFQMDGQIELILVNDGSTDASGAICDEYANKCQNVHVIHKTNGGTCSAKNMGIDAAKGMYISFLDCDDFFEPDTFVQVIPVLLEQQPDCLDFGFRYGNAKGEYIDNIHQCRKNVLMSQQELEMVILPPLLNLRKDDAHFVFDFCCNKIFKADIVRNFDIRFDENRRTWEDRIFLIRHLKHCQNYYAMDKCFYNYVYTPNSLGQRYDLEFFRIVLSNFQCYRNMFGEQFDFDTQYVNNYWAGVIERMIFWSLEQEENQEIIRNNIIETLKNEQVIYWFAKRKTDNSFEAKVQALVISGQCDKALDEYSKKLQQRCRRETLNQIKLRIKRIAQKALGK